MALYKTDRGSVGEVAAYARHRPGQTLLYQLVEQHFPAFVSQLSTEGITLPSTVQREFEDYLKCGRLEYGFLRVRCTDCHQERLVAFSCKRCGFCPSCGARRMTESAALLVDEILPQAPMRQWVLSVPYPLEKHIRFAGRHGGWHQPPRGREQVSRRSPDYPRAHPRAAAPPRSCG